MWRGRLFCVVGDGCGAANNSVWMGLDVQIIMWGWVIDLEGQIILWVIDVEGQIIMWDG